MRTIRFRITFIASIVVAAVLVAAGAALILLQQSALTETIDQGLIQRADDIEASLAEGAVPDQFGAVGDEGFVQLVADDGSVVASTPNLGAAPSLDLPSEPTGDTIGTVTGLAVDDDAFRYVSRPLGDMRLFVGTTYDVVGEASAALARSLALTVPIVVVVLAGLVWWLVGRTLRPVESIRSEVASIGSEDLAKRVPEPGTGDEVDRLAMTMNQMLGRLEESVSRQQRFVADASHELRIPLTRLRSELELALATKPTEQRGRYRSLLEETIAMQAIVEDLLFLARLDEHQEMPRRPVDFDDVVLDEVGKARAHSTVDVQLDGISAVLVLGDRSGLARAVSNLLSNAQRHAESAVWVSLAEVGGEAVLAVSDNGPGVPIDAAALVFDRFARVDEARSSGSGGTGLGLAIARDIVERHGGRLELTNAGSPGARFEIRIPAQA